MASQSVFLGAAQLLEGRFTTDAADRKEGRLTPYAAVKQAFGVDRDDHPIAYNGSEWPLLADRMSQAFDVLDDLASLRAGRETQFIVWSTQPDRTLVEVRSILTEADQHAPHLAVVEPAELRPSTPGMVGVRKHRWIICNLVGTVAEGRQSQVADVIRSVVPLDDRSDRDVIEQLDTIVDAEGLPHVAARTTRVHLELSRAWGTTELRGLRFGEAVAAIGPPSFWDGCDDTALERVLARRFPSQPGPEATQVGSVALRESHGGS